MRFTEDRKCNSASHCSSKNTFFVAPEFSSINIQLHQLPAFSNNDCFCNSQQTLPVPRARGKAGLYTYFNELLYRKRRDAATAIKQCFFPEQRHWLFRRLNSDSTRCKHMRLCRCHHFSGHWPTHRLRPCLSVCRYLVGVEHFAGEWIVFQGAGGAGAAVIQHFTAVLHLLFILALQICCYLRMLDRHLRLGHKSTAHILQNYSTVELEFSSYGEWRIVGTEVVPALVLQLLHHLVHRTLQPRFNRDSRLP